MIEVIKDYCSFHKLSVDVTFFAKTWAVKLDSARASTGWVYADDFNKAFNEAKKIYESRK